MNNRSLFTDASLNPKLKVGVGGYLIVPESFIKTPSNLIKISEIENPRLAVRITDALGTAIDKGFDLLPAKN